MEGREGRAGPSPSGPFAIPRRRSSPKEATAAPTWVSAVRLLGEVSEVGPVLGGRGTSQVLPGWAASAGFGGGSALLGLSRRAAS